MFSCLLQPIYITQSLSMPDEPQNSRRRSAQEHNERPVNSSAIAQDDNERSMNPGASRNDQKRSERQRASSHGDVPRSNRSRSQRRRNSRRTGSRVRRPSRRESHRSRSRQRSGNHNSSRRNQQNLSPARGRGIGDDQSRHIVSRSRRDVRYGNEKSR